MQHEGFAELVGLEIFPESNGTSVGSLLIEKAHLNPNGVAHGGALFTLVDTCLGAALMQRLDAGEICATLQISMNFLKPVLAGEVRCKLTLSVRGSVLRTCAASFTSKKSSSARPMVTLPLCSRPRHRAALKP